MYIKFIVSGIAVPVETTAAKQARGYLVFTNGPPGWPGTDDALARFCFPLGADSQHKAKNTMGSEVWRAGWQGVGLAAVACCLQELKDA
jgi:hypothetical protein